VECGEEDLERRDGRRAFMGVQQPPARSIAAETSVAGGCESREGGDVR
jgi:hypothetical protein